MPGIEIKSLCSRNRVADDFVKISCLLLYLPFGLVLLTLRLVLGLQVLLFSYILPDVPIVRNVLTKLLSVTFGITISVENPKDREDGDVFISNQVSILDHFIIHSATDSLIPTSDLQINTFLSSLLGVYSYGPVYNLDAIKKNIAAFLSTKKQPLHFQPEGFATNGKALLKFKTWPFGFSRQVQPVCLEVTRPFLDLSVTTIDNSYWTDVFCYLFSPCTSYKLRFLSTVEKKDLNDADFAEKVRQNLATALRIESSCFSSADVIDWRKRYQMERIRRIARPTTQTLLNVSPEIEIMANQVKEVLPLVPYNVIVKDLVKTRSVDITISNILEGHVPYTPVSEPKTSHTATAPTVSISNAPSTSSVSSKGITLSTGASSFPKSAQERMLSFQERKAQLVQDARKKYIEKHGLSIVALNNC